MAKIIESSGMDKFNSDLEKNIAKLDRLSSSADKATSSIDKLSEAYNKLQELANEPIKFNIKGSSSKANGSYSRTSGSSKSERSGNTRQSSKNKKDDNIFSKASKGIKQSNDFFNVVTDFGSSIKNGKISSAASAASKGLGLMGGALGTAAIAVGGVTAALAVLSKVTLDANRKTTEYAKSLRAVGVELSDFDKRSLNTSNQMRDIGNRFDNIIQSLGEGLYPVLEGFVNLLDKATGGISSTESKDKIASSQSNIATSAQQSGFDLNSSMNLAGNTYRTAQEIANQTSEQASDVAKKLADAWLNGSDAAKEYGVVVNDQVLTGYMASQGVDIANVEITDAMKQYYRYQLMMEELNADSRETMQNMIKEWTQLGFIIDKTKGKLFSFDEVIQLTATDTTIPSVSGSGLVYPDDTDDENGGTTPNPNTTPNPSIDNNTEALNINTGALDNNTSAINNNTEALKNINSFTNPNFNETSDPNFNENSTTNDNEINTNIPSEINPSSPSEMPDEDIGSAARLIIAASSRFMESANYLNNATNNIVQSISTSANNAANMIGSVSGQYMNNISNVANQNVSNIINIGDYMNNSIINQANQGKIAVGQTTIAGMGQINQATGYGVNTVGKATSNGVNQLNATGKSNITHINSVGKSNINSVNSTGKSNITSINSVGNSWVSKLNSLGAQIASMLGARISGYRSSSRSSSRSSRTSSNSKSKTTKIIPFSKLSSQASSSKSSSSKSSSSKSSSSSGGIFSPFDLITEGADLITSIKDDNGKYKWSKLPGATVDMAISSVSNPIGALSTGYKLGKESNGILGGITGAIGNLAGYVGLETFGDLVNLSELVQDGVIGAWNKITGSNVTSTDSKLTQFSGAIDSLLNDMVNGTGSYSHFADGGIGTKEVHNATLFEGNKKEAVIPLESDAGIKYLSDAMIQAQGMAGQSLGGDITINLTLSGVNIADNDAQWEKVGRKLAEVIEVQRQRRGELNYGSSF